MKANIEAASREQANHIRTALADPFILAFTAVMGALLPLPIAERQRVLALAGERLVTETAPKHE